MMTTFAAPEFHDENEAKAYFEQFLRPWFYLKPEVWLTYPNSGNSLRIDYLAKPKDVDGTGFPFPIFGIECKPWNSAGTFNRAVKQAIDYTRCRISDRRDSLQKLAGQRVERVYLFPAPCRKTYENKYLGHRRAGERTQEDIGTIALATTADDPRAAIANPGTKQAMRTCVEPRGVGDRIGIADRRQRSLMRIGLAQGKRGPAGHGTASRQRVPFPTS
jgi:hypothetical protein